MDRERQGLHCKPVKLRLAYVFFGCKAKRFRTMPIIDRHGLPPRRLLPRSVTIPTTNTRHGGLSSSSIVGQPDRTSMSARRVESILQRIDEFTHAFIAVKRVYL